MPKKETPPKEVTKVSERSLPTDLNAEAAILCAMIIDSTVVSKGIEMIQEEYLSRTANKLIFRTICELFDEGVEIDALTLVSRMQRNDTLEKAGGIPYINEVSSFVVSAANFEYHLKLVIDKALLRHLILSCNGIIESCYSSPKPVNTILDEAEQAIFSLAELQKRPGFVKIDQLSKETYGKIDTIFSTKIPVVGVSSGFSDLDRITSGFRPGQFIIIAARPGMGKTALALNMATHAAVDLGKKVGIFTMEMAAEEVVMRMFSSAAEVSSDSMLKGFGMNEEKLIRIMQASDVFSTKQIYIDESGTNSPLEIRAKVRRLAAELGGLDLVIIDYLQLMTLAREKDNRQQEIAEISRALKILAKDMSIPVIALSQLNRLLETREDKRPRLSDLRESGAIEQDADLVIFIYRDEEYYHEKSDSPGVAEIIVGKNRHGPTGTALLGFVKEFTLFRPTDTTHEL